MREKTHEDDSGYERGVRNQLKNNKRIILAIMRLLFELVEVCVLEQGSETRQTHE